MTAQRGGKTEGYSKKKRTDDENGKIVVADYNSSSESGGEFLT
jgi:hypothetical protein